MATPPVSNDLTAVLESLKSLKEGLEEQRKAQASLIQQVAVLQQEKSQVTKPVSYTHLTLPTIYSV